jgi:hypothetical protein
VYNFKQDSANNSIKQKRITIENDWRNNKDTVLQNPITIPVIFHLMKRSSNKYPKVKDIEDQLNLVNIIFNRILEENGLNKKKVNKNIPAEKLAAKLDLSFCFAKSTLAQNQSIIVSNNTAKEWKISDKITDVNIGGSKIIEPAKAINIYLADIKDNLAGFAQMPGGDPLTDIIVIDYDYFGISNDKSNPYRAGKTLPHLIGSYLGIKELWNEYEKCVDDGVDDTPIHNSPNFDEVGEGHISTCEGYPVEMVMNLMDNTHDDNLTLFTHGQKKRVHYMLSSKGPRNSLAKSNLCVQNLESRSFAKFDFNIHPNPSQDHIYIELLGNSNKNTTFSIFDITGNIKRKLSISSSGDNSTYLDISELKAGFYSIRAIQGNEKITKSFIVVK